MLYHDEAKLSRQKVLNELKRLQQMCEPVIRIVQSIIDKAYAAVPGELTTLVPSENVLSPLSPSPTQPIDECFEGKDYNPGKGLGVPAEMWSKAVRTELQKAQTILRTKGDDYLRSELYVNPKDVSRL